MTSEAMSWDEAIDALMDGQVLTREAWADYEVVVQVPGLAPRSGRWLTEDDIKASDWLALGRLQ